ncbi:MAG: MFS transporter, partial [Myxococcota bacterium]|nr:MFS transporter [Myxococcota bacterium]
MSGQPEVGYVELLRGNIQFRNLYIARLVSLLGDWFNLIAILALLRSIGADSASAFGGALIVKALPSVVVTPWAGDLADRFSRKGIMLMSDVLRAFVVFGLFIVLWFP